MDYGSKVDRAVVRPTFEVILAGPLLLTLLVKVPGFSLVPASFAIGLVLLPVIWRQLRGQKILRWLLFSVAFAIVTGIIIQLFTVQALGSSSGSAVAIQVVIWLISFPLIVGLGLWSLQRVRLRTGLILVLIGAAVDTFLLDPHFEWKGTQGIYITALLLLIFARHRFITFIVMAGSIAVSATNDARSMAIVGALTLLVWFVTRQTNKDAQAKRRGTIALIIVLASASVASIWAMANGLFGQAVQLRTLDQLNRPAFFIADARVEWSATTVLFQNHPIGFGPGVVPSDALQTASVNAIQAAGGDYTAPYFTQVMFGPRVDMHSMLADLWFHFGIGGVLVAAIIAVLLIGGLRHVAHARTAIGITGIYAVLIGLWDLLFSPMANSDRLIFAALCVVGVAISHLAQPEVAESAELNTGSLSSTPT